MLEDRMDVKERRIKRTMKRGEDEEEEGEAGYNKWRSLVMFGVDVLVLIRYITPCLAKRLPCSSCK